MLSEVKHLDFSLEIFRYAQNGLFAVYPGYRRLFIIEAGFITDF